MTEKQIQLDSGILQFTPKGGFYEGADEQFKMVFDMWYNLFQFDRTLFCLTSLLGGTGFSKGAMNHMLLSNAQSTTGKELIPEGLAFDYESQVIRYNLTKEKTPRALKNLLMLAGKENSHTPHITAATGKSRVNNARTRKIILDYLFNREHISLDNLAVNYKGKMKTLIRHALGKIDLHKVLNGDTKIFNKWIGRYNINALPVLFYLFDKELPKDTVFAHFPKVHQVQLLKKAAIEGNVDEFLKHMKGLPHLTVMGYRNTYKVPIDKSEVYTKTTMTTRQKLKSESAAKRSGATIEVNYKKQDIYDLWKVFYHKLMTGDGENLDDVAEAITFQEKRLEKVDFGTTAVIIDCSASMRGSDQRPLHPFLTSLSILSILDNITHVSYIGGTIPYKEGKRALFPKGSTDLWRGLISAVASGAESIIVFSDGYENCLKGTFNHVYKHFKESGYKFNLIHINPVFAADAKKGTSRKLAEDVTPLPVTDYKFIETEMIFNRMIENRDAVKSLLLNKYKKLIGG